MIACEKCYHTLVNALHLLTPFWHFHQTIKKLRKLHGQAELIIVTS